MNTSKKMSIWLYSAWRLAFFIRNVTSNQPNFANCMTLTNKWVHLQDTLSRITMHMPQRHIWMEDIKLPPIFNLDSRWRWVVNIPAALPHYPLNKRQSQPQGMSAHFAGEKNLFPQPRIWMDHPAHSIVTMLTEIPKRYPPRYGTKIDSPHSFLVHIHYQQNNHFKLK